MGNKSHRKLLIGFLFSASLFLTGCAGTAQYHPFPDQTKENENPEYARIYVMRPTSFGSAVPTKIYDGSELIGKTGPKGYLCWERKPGEITIEGHAENTSRLKLNVQKGHTYYVKQAIHMGFLIARNALYGLSADEGPKVLEKCKPPKLEISKE